MTALSRLVLNSNTGLCGFLPGSFATLAGAVTSPGSSIGTSCASPPPSPPTPPSPPPDASTVLLALKASISNWPGQALLPGWDLSVAPDWCTWAGVTCSSGLVVSISLNSYGLVGTLPSGVSAIGSLTQLLLAGNS